MKTKLSKAAKIGIAAGVVVIVGAIIAVLIITGASKDSMKDVTLGRSVAVDSSNVAFWGHGNYLCSGLVDDAGSIGDFTIEAQMTSGINSLAVFESDLYVAAADGFFRYGLEEMEKGGTVKPKQLMDDSLSDGFEIYDGKIYYIYGYTLYSMNTSGKGETTVAEDVNDYDVTSDGIYYTKKDGNIYLLSTDGAQQNLLAKTEEPCTINITGDNIYYSSQKGKDVYVYNIKKETSTKAYKKEALAPYSYVWANEDYMLYKTDSYKCRIVSLADVKEFKATDADDLPDKEQGVMVGNTLYGYNKYSGKLYEYNLADKTYKETKMEEVLADLLAKSEKKSSPSNSGSYDIADNIIRYAGEGSEDMLDTKYFSLLVPNDVEWEWEKNDSTSITIYYSPAKKSNGGEVVTIAAYDWGSNAYGDLPDYTIAGKTEDKIYVAIFPTDQQVSSTDEKQSSEYAKLVKHMRNVNDKATSGSNPFSVK
ncbi:MAG: hypothetical protein GX663_08260 [Clostridiales bacterium]|nr:hypothetical protein [Clostridiales bacterium]